MIKINLAAKISSGRSGAAGAGVDLGGALEILKDPIIRKYIIAVGLIYISSVVIEDKKTELINLETTKLEQITKKKAGLTTELEKKKDLDEAKTQLEDEERIIRSKLTALNRLVKERSLTPTILNTVGSAIPPVAWVEKIWLNETGLYLEFKTLNENAATEFLSHLRQNTNFNDLRILDISKKVVRNEEVTLYKVTTQKQGALPPGGAQQ